MAQQDEKEEKKDESLFQSNDPTTIATQQFIHEFCNKVFSKGDVDPNNYKILLPGNIGPTAITWNNVENGQYEIVNFCNKQPGFGVLAYFGEATDIPNGYSLCLNGIQMPDGDESQEYKDAIAKVNKVLNAKSAMFASFKIKFQNYVEGNKRNKSPQTYTTCTVYIKGEYPDDWSKYELLATEQKDAESNLRNVQLQKDKTNPVVKAIHDWDAWSTKTDNGTNTADAFWKTSNDIRGIIAEWKLQPPKYSGGGSFSVTKASKLYERIVVQPKLSGLWDIFSIGIAGGVDKTITKDSKYTITVSWLASATTQLTAPSAYNLQLVKSMRSDVHSNYKGPVPMTGTADANIQGVVTSATIMFGVTIKGTFDAQTYKSIKEKAGASVVCFGIFGIGVQQTYTKTEWDDKGYSFTATADTNEPFVVGMTIDTLA